MATQTDTELDEVVINDVLSDELLQQLADSGQLVEHQLYITPDIVEFGSNTEGSGSGKTTTIWRDWE